jgi:hypothetical protein
MTDNTPLFFENLLLKFLYIKADVRDKVLSFLTPAIFDNKENKQLIEHIFEFSSEYKSFPNGNDTRLYFSNKKNQKAVEQFDYIMSIDEKEYDDEFLLDELESFIREKLVYNVCIDTVALLSEGKLKECNESPEKLKNAYSFSFDTKIGTNLLKSKESIYEQLHEKRKIKVYINKKCFILIIFY